MLFWCQICLWTLKTLKSYLTHKYAIELSNHSSQIFFTSNESTPLQSLSGRLIIQVRFYFSQMFLFYFISICAHYIFQSVKSYALNLKLHSMHSDKFFHTQGTQTIFLLTRNTLNGFKQAFQHSTLTNKPLNILNTQLKCFWTLNTFKPLK